MLARHIQAALLTLAATMLFTSTVPSGQAHTMTYGLGSVANITIGAGGSGGMWLFQNQGPADKTWVVRVTIGLNGGNNVQYSRFTFTLQDNAIGTFAEYRAGADNWISNGTCCYLYGDTLTIHAGGTISVQLLIYNPDSSSQQFYVTWQSHYF